MFLFGSLNGRCGDFLFVFVYLKGSFTVCLVLLLDSKAFHMTGEKFAVFILKQDFLLSGIVLQLIFLLSYTYTEISIKWSIPILNVSSISSWTPTFIMQIFHATYWLSKNMFIKSAFNIKKRKIYLNLKTETSTDY